MCRKVGFSDEEGVKNKIPVVTPQHVLALIQGKQSLWNSIFAAYALIPQGSCEASQDQALAFRTLKPWYDFFRDLKQL